VSAIEPRRWVTGLRAQWLASQGLRLGVLTIVALLWVQALLMAGDVIKSWHEREVSLRDDLSRVQALARERAWPQRAEDARGLVNALRSMVWPESDRGVAEASIQDWIRATAAKANLRLREVALIRVAPGAAPAASATVASTQSVRIRVITELDRLPLAGFLAELARHERAVMVDRLVVRTATQPPMAEMELRMVTAAVTSGIAK
jgi:Type II secretion system (T2SS), protein M subtype b